MVEVGWRGIVSVGDLRERDLEDIWIDKYRSGYYRLRSEILDNSFSEFDVCSDCTIWSATTYFTEIHKDYIRVYNETLEIYRFKRKG